MAGSTFHFGETSGCLVSHCPSSFSPQKECELARKNSRPLPNHEWPGPATTGDDGRPRPSWLDLSLREVRERQAFESSFNDIISCFSNDSDIAAKRRLKRLMAKLIENPSGQTMELFTRLQRRFWWCVDAYQFLEANWGAWATTEMRLELIRHK